MKTYWTVIMLVVIIIDLTLQEMKDRDCAKKAQYTIAKPAALRSLYAGVPIFWLQPVSSNAKIRPQSDLLLDKKTYTAVMCSRGARPCCGKL